MQTIIVTVNKDHTEDDVLDLVESLSKIYGSNHVTARTAIVVDTDIPEIISMFVKINTSGMSALKDNLSDTCPDCGEPAKPGKRCSSCQHRINATGGRPSRQERARQEIAERDSQTIAKWAKELAPSGAKETQ